MITIHDKTRDIMNVIGALLWIFLVFVSWIENPILSYAGLVAVTLLSVIYFILGTTVRGKTGFLIPLIYPCLSMAVLWIVAFTVAYTTRGKTTTTWIFGLHPGQFWFLLFFWIGTFLTSTLGYALYFDSYLLPESDWQAFVEKVKKEKSGKENSNE